MSIRVENLAGFLIVTFISRPIVSNVHCPKRFHPPRTLFPRRSSFSRQGRPIRVHTIEHRVQLIEHAVHESSILSARLAINRDGGRGRRHEALLVTSEYRRLPHAPLTPSSATPTVDDHVTGGNFTGAAEPKDFLLRSDSSGSSRGEWSRANPPLTRSTRRSVHHRVDRSRSIILYWSVTGVSLSLSLSLSLSFFLSLAKHFHFFPVLAREPRGEAARAPTVCGVWCFPCDTCHRAPPEQKEDRQFVSSRKQTNYACERVREREEGEERRGTETRRDTWVGGTDANPFVGNSDR